MDLHWPDPLIELLGFLALFLAVGAAAFRIVVLGGARRHAGADETSTFQAIERRAAVLGLIGALIWAGLWMMSLPEQADRAKMTVGEMLSSNPQAKAQAVLRLTPVLGFALAAGRIGFGVGLAGLALVLAPFLGGFFGNWNRVVTPVHRFAAAMWIGTLFVMVTAGLGTVLRSQLASERRGRVVAAIVNAFSPLALISTAVLAVFGVITAWQHLHTVDALWTTVYGRTLIVKLLLVGVVLALGAWNWRRQKPRLGSEAGAIGLQRSATSELVAAALVLIGSAILVSVPSPRRPGSGPGGPPPAGAPAQAPESGAPPSSAPDSSR